MTFSPLKVGILGGGQLAQMLALAARQIGIVPFVFVRNKLECAAQVTSHVFIDDGTADTFRDFLREVDLVTIENEFINLDQIQNVLNEMGKPIYPSIENLKLVQSKLDQKRFLTKNKIPTLPFESVSSSLLMENAWSKFKGHLVIKKARFGYDGRGTFIFRGPKDKPRFDKLRDELFSGPNESLLYAEAMADFQKELAVMVTRSTSGEIRTYSTIETFQEKGMCSWALAPAEIKKSQALKAQKVACNIMTKLKAVGTFGVEFFLLKSGDVVVNEIAPRVHNSGHLTMNATSSGQFEQHLRAISGMPLGSTKLRSKGVAMVNIIGGVEKTSSTPVVCAGEDSWLHWYGKSGPTLGRKLGHINSNSVSPKMALKKALVLRKKILI
jgi:phosphoribosylaminoimidazole carboxylase PurK protein